MFIPDQKTATKERGEKNLLSYLTWSHKFHKIKNYFILELLNNKIWANFQRIIELIIPKIVTKLSKIWVWDPGSGKILSRIPSQGSKRHRIPDPQHCQGPILLLRNHTKETLIRSTLKVQCSFPDKKNRFVEDDLWMRTCILALSTCHFLSLLLEKVLYGTLCYICIIANRVADPWHFGVDPDPRMHASD